MVSINYQNFLDEVREDLKQMIIDNYPTRKQLEEAPTYKIYDDAFIDDAVTGNGSGSYYFNARKSQENIMKNEEVVEEMIDEFGVDMRTHGNDWEYLDVSCRCYLLGQINIEALIEEIKEENGWDEPLVFEGAQVADAINVARGMIKGGKAAVDIDFFEDGKISVDEADTMNTEEKKDKESIISTTTIYEEDFENPIDDIIEGIKTDVECNCEWATIE